MGAVTSISNSISSALGTDGSNNGLLPAVSNALGTDGSKNGLLNDPVSMAALAIATGVYFAPELGIMGAANAGTGAAATESGLLALDVIAPATNTAVASVTAGSAATAGAGVLAGIADYLPSWASIASLGTEAAKVALPVYLQQAQQKQQFSQQKELLTLQRNNGLTGYGQGLNTYGQNGYTVQPAGVTVKGLGSFGPMLLIGGAALIAYKLTR